MGLKFSLENAGIPGDATIDSAIIKLYVKEQPYYQGGTATSKYGVYRITQAWTATTRWNPFATQPVNNDVIKQAETTPVTIDPVAVSLKTMSMLPGDGQTYNPLRWVSYSVTSAIKTFLANPASNNGFLIRELFKPDGNDMTAEYSSSRDVVTQRPSLVIYYHGGTTGMIHRATGISPAVSIKKNSVGIHLSGFTGNPSDVSVNLFDMQGKAIAFNRVDDAGIIRLMPVAGATGFQCLLASVKVGRSGESVGYRIVN